MIDAPPFETEPITGGTRYRLPPRELGKFRFVGVAGIIIGCIFALIPLGMVSAFFFNAPSGSGPVGWAFRIIPALIGLAFVTAGLSVARLGLFALAGRTEIDVLSDTIRTTERAGPIWRTRKVRNDRIRSLSIGSANTNQPNMDANLSALQAHVEGKRKSLNLAVGYDFNVLAPLRAELQEALGEDVSSYDETNLAHGVPPAPAGMNEPRTGAIPLPRHSTISIIDTNDGVTIKVPPAGSRGSKGLLGFGIIWTGFTVCWLTGAIWMGLKSGQPANLIPFVLFGLVFLAVGIAMLLGAINMAKREALIDLVPGALLITRKSIFGVKSHEWLAEELDYVRVGGSGMSVNDVEIQALLVKGRIGKKLTLFSSREDDELHWLAARINAHLSGEDPPAH